jgi:hypothetical protein
MEDVMTQTLFDFAETVMESRVSQIWRETDAELSKPYSGNCSVCGGPVRCFPFIENEMLRAVVICPCCSSDACQCRSPREKQMDSALAIIDAGGTWKRAAKVAGLDVSGRTRDLVNFWAKHRRVETTDEYAARCCA